MSTIQGKFLMKWDKEKDGIFTMPKYIEKRTKELRKLAESRSDEWVKNELTKRRLASKKRNDKAIKIKKKIMSKWPENINSDHLKQ